MQTTLCLPDNVANRIREIVEPFGGTVPGYAAKLAINFSMLPLEEQKELHDLIQLKLKRHEAQTARGKRDAHDIGGVPAIPNR